MVKYILCALGDLMHLLEKIKEKSFLVFGRAGIDLYADPAGTSAETSEMFCADLGGSSANICAGLSKLGCQSALVTSVSDDVVGRFCLNRLAHYGVDTQFIKIKAGEHRTSLAVYESRLDNFQLCLYRNNAVDFQVDNQDVDQVDYASYGALITAGTVFAGEPSRGSTFRAFEHAKKAGLPVIFDIDYRPYSWSSSKVASDVLTRAGMASDLIVGNDEEFGFMAGEYDKGLDQARALAEQGKLVIYKKGSEGAITFAEDAEIRTGIYPVTAIKPNGAGDSFLAGMLAAIAHGCDLKHAILRGSACASIVVSNPGCAPAMPDKPTLEAFLESHPGPTATL